MSGHLDTTKYTDMVGNAASQVKISSTKFKAFIGDVKDKNDSNYDLLDANNENAIGMKRQAIINGNFDVWQRGTILTNPSSASYTADRWKIGNANPDGGIFPTNTIHSQQTLTSGDVANSFYFYRVAPDGAGSGFGANAEYTFRQLIENGTRFLCGLNKKVTLSFWAKSSIATKRIGVCLVQNYGSGGSPTANEVLNGNTFTLTSSWQRFTMTFTTNTLAGKTFGSNNDDSLFLEFGHLWGSARFARYGATTMESFVGAGNIDIAQVQINSGDQALPFQPQSVDDETKKSLRYTWIPQTNSVFVRATTYTANTLVFDVPLTVQLRTTPTIRGTVNTDLIAYTVAGVAQTGFTGVAATLTSSGVRVTMTKTTHGLTDAYMEIKTTSGFDSEL